MNIIICWCVVNFFCDICEYEELKVCYCESLQFASISVLVHYQHSVKTTFFLHHPELILISLGLPVSYTSLYEWNWMHDSECLKISRTKKTYAMDVFAFYNSTSHVAIVAVKKYAIFFFTSKTKTDSSFSICLNCYHVWFFNLFQNAFAVKIFAVSCHMFVSHLYWSYSLSSGLSSVSWFF